MTKGVKQRTLCVPFLPAGSLKLETRGSPHGQTQVRRCISGMIAGITPEGVLRTRQLLSRSPGHAVHSHVPIRHLTSSSQQSCREGAFKPTVSDEETETLRTAGLRSLTQPRERPGFSTRLRTAAPRPPCPALSPVLTLGSAAPPGASAACSAARQRGPSRGAWETRVGRLLGGKALYFPELITMKVTL